MWTNIKFLLATYWSHMRVSLAILVHVNLIQGLCPGFANFVPKLACSIHATWTKPFNRTLYTRERVHLQFSIFFCKMGKARGEGQGSAPDDKNFFCSNRPPSLIVSKYWKWSARMRGWQRGRQPRGRWIQIRSRPLRPRHRGVRSVWLVIGFGKSQALLRIFGLRRWDANTNFSKLVTTKPDLKHGWARSS